MLTPLNIVVKFLRLHKSGSLVIFLLAILAGIAQSIAAASLLPLTIFLGLDLSSDNRIMRLFHSVLDFVHVPLSLLVALSLIVIAIVVSAFLNFFARLISARVAALLVRRFRTDLIESLLNAKFSAFNKIKTGALVNSIVSEASKSAVGYMDAVNFFSSLVQCIVLVSVTLLISLPFGLTGIIVGALIVTLFLRWNLRAYCLGQDNLKKTQDISESIADGMRNIKPLKAMARENCYGTLLLKETRILEKQQIQLFLVTAIPQTVREPIVALALVFIVYFMITQNQISTENVIPLVVLLQRFAQQFGAAHSGYQTMRKMEPYLDTLLVRTSGLKKSIEEESGNKEIRSFKTIEFKDVSFAYQGHSVLHKKNLTINAGELTVLMGPSGAGKTTILDLLCRLYTPDEGQILVDGKDLREYSLTSWRGILGYMPQDPMLLHDSIRNNITLNDPMISDQQVEDSLRRVGLDHLLRRDNVGIDATLGEGGRALSGGQGQRLALARALIMQPLALILDEPTSALDQESEVNFLERLLELRNSGLTIIAVSHKPALWQFADKAIQIPA